ncbi:MAG: hypothetical protein FVQ80_10055 [Planctomycetes bacterium]|nr:hypothetical protein [Planctomycetota bacterium]
MSKYKLQMVGCFIVLMLVSGCESTTTAETKKLAKPWWLKKPMRMIQTNLREIDATLDVDEYIEDISKFNANVVMVNVGGIVANYSTELEYQYRNPRMKGDLIGRLIEKLHAKGIKVIGRFDFSKLNETIAAKKPEWLYKSVKGEIVNYNGQVHTCVNGGYQQEYLFKILGEAIDKYPLDGLFFNMIGYNTWDYSGNYHGVCQSDACRKRYKEWSGLDLPTQEKWTDPVFLKYHDFRVKTSDELFRKVKDFIKNKRSDIAICTYTDAGVDIIRDESNSALDRALPEWNYSASDNVRSAINSWKDKTIGNVAINFVDYRARHSAVSPHLTELRLVQNMLNGGWLDYCVIGTLGNQDDRTGFGPARGVFEFHAKNEKWLRTTRSSSDICVIKGNWDEYRGIFRILSENHVLFDVISQKALDSDTPRKLESYQLIILPDIQNLSDEMCKRLDEYVKGGGKILATGRTSTANELGNDRGSLGLKSAGIKEGFKVRPQTKGTYLRIRDEDKNMLGRKSLRDLDIAYLTSDFLECEAAGKTKGLLRLIPEAMFGPPEKCYYTEVTDIPGLFYNEYGKGAVAFFPWYIGTHYEKRSNGAHSRLLMGGLEGLLKFEKSLSIKTSALVEINRQADVKGRFEWFGFINHSGQNGTAFHKPLRMYELQFKFKPKRRVRRIIALGPGHQLDFIVGKDGLVTTTLPRLGRFEVVLVEY